MVVCPKCICLAYRITSVFIIFLSVYKGVDVPSLFVKGPAVSGNMNIN